MTTTERLAAAIETARANLGVDWAELSRRSGVYPKHAYVAWELHALAKALNVDMLDLLDGTVQSVGPMLWCEPRRPR